MIGRAADFDADTTAAALGEFFGSALGDDAAAGDDDDALADFFNFAEDVAGE